MLKILLYSHCSRCCCWIVGLLGCLVDGWWLVVQFVGGVAEVFPSISNWNFGQNKKKDLTVIIYWELWQTHANSSCTFNGFCCFFCYFTNIYFFFSKIFVFFFVIRFILFQFNTDIRSSRAALSYSRSVLFFYNGVFVVVVVLVVVLGGSLEGEFCR